MKSFKVMIDIDPCVCKGCMICVAACPKGVYKKSRLRNESGSPMPEAENESVCVVCELCERLCPDGAINVVKYHVLDSPMLKEESSL